MSNPDLKLHVLNFLLFLIMCIGVCIFECKGLWRPWSGEDRGHCGAGVTGVLSQLACHDGK